MGLLDPVFALFGMDPGVERARKKEWAGDIDGAIKTVHDLIKAKGPTPKRHNALAWFYVIKGEPAEALKFADKAVEAAPKSLEYQAVRARALRRLGRHEEALEAMKKRFMKNKMDIFNASELCELLVDMNRPLAAVPIYKEMVGMFGGEVNTPLARQIGMSQAFEHARDRLKQARVI